jgi:hypothetical protein
MQTAEPANELEAFARALNPEGGALLDALPFTLTPAAAPAVEAETTQQAPLWSDDDGEASPV